MRLNVYVYSTLDYMFRYGNDVDFDILWENVVNHSQTVMNQLYLWKQKYLQVRGNK